MTLRDTFLDQIGLWGNPYHGLVVAGTLTLPNASTKTWDQPSGGDVDVVRAPENPAITRTEDELIYDATLGHEWRNYSLISGSTRQYYGQDLGANAWIYVPAVGNAFLLKKTATLSCTADASGGAASLRFTVIPLYFGSGADAETVRTLDVGLDYLGQPRWNGTTDINLTATLATQSESGAQALFALTYSGAIVGWLMATVTGTTQAGIEIVLSVWKSRAQAFYGTYTATRTGASENVGVMGKTSSTQCNTDGGEAAYLATWGVTSTSGAPDVYAVAANYSDEVSHIRSFVLGAGFSGETAIDVRVYIASQTLKTQTGALTIYETLYKPDRPGCGGPQLAEWSIQVDGTSTATEYIDVFVAGVSKAKAMHQSSYGGTVVDDFIGQQNNASVEGTTVTATETISWTGFDGATTTLHDAASILAPERFYLPVTEWDTSSAISDSDLLTAYQRFFTGTPSNASGYVPIRLDYAGTVHAAGFRPLGYKVGVCCEAHGATYSVEKLITPYGPAPETLSLSSWSAQAGVKVSHQPETDEISLDTTFARCWV